MARSSDAGRGSIATTLAALVVLGLFLALAKWLLRAIGWPTILGGGAAILALWVFKVIAESSSRRTNLMRRFGDEDLVRRIMGHELWMGQAEDHLLASLGHPATKHIKQSADGRDETWQYERSDGLKVMLRGGIVVGWDFKEQTSAKG